MPTPTFKKGLFLLLAACILTPILSAQPRLDKSLLDDKAGTPSLVEKVNVFNCNRNAIVTDYINSIDSTVVSNAELNWTGNVTGCIPGTISTSAMAKTFTRINYFRRLVGVRDSITMRADWSSKDQEAALMFKANNMLSHTPPTDWICYTANGAQAAGSSNISIGGHSSASVNQYIQDGGANNTAAGHRRWILYTRATEFGFGSTNSSTAMWVIGSFVNPPTVPEYIAYPSAGYFPKPLAYQRWSFAVPSGDFANATVEMFDDKDVPYTVTLEPLANGYGDNTIVWTNNLGALPPTADKFVRVKVNNVVVGNQTKNYEYKILLINPVLQNIQTVQKNPTCGQNNGSIKLSYAPGYKKIEWSNGKVGQDSITDLAPGTYYASITDQLDCVKIDTVELADTSTVATAEITYSGDLNICPSEQLELTASGGATYLWSTTAATASINAAAAGDYTVTVTNTFGCTDVATVQVTASSSPTIAIAPSGSTSLCTGQSVFLTASGGISYAWSSGAGTPTISANTTGGFTVTATDALGCTGTATQLVEVHAPPAVTINPNGLVQLCPGESVQLEASGASTYVWSTGNASATLPVDTAGTFTVTATDAFGCSAIATQSVIVQPNLTVSIAPSGPTEFCAGQSVEIVASGGSLFQWNNSASTAAITVDGSGTYTVTATSAFGCTGTASVTVVVHENPQAKITAPGGAQLCAGVSIQLTASGGDTYAWNNSQTTPTITVSQAGIYRVTATNAFGCTGTAIQVVAAHPAPPVAIAPTGAIQLCSGQSVELKASGGDTYLWSTGSGNAALTVNTAGTFTVTATDAFGCTATASQTVTVQPGITVSVTPTGSPELCAGKSVELTASGGTTYQWSTGGTTPTITVNTSGGFTVTATNAFGCSGTATRIVLVHDAPVAAVSTPGAGPFCTGQSVALTASGGDTYKWSTGSNNPVLSVTNGGTYTVTVTNGFGCTATATQTVSMLPKPNALIIPSGPTTFCQGQNVTLVAIGTEDYQWSTGSKENVIVVTASGLYTVTVTNAAGCTATATQSVTVQPAPTAAIAAAGPTEFCAGKSVQLTASGGTSYTWSTGNFGPVITAMTAGTYTVTTSNGAGCTASAQQTVVVHPGPVIEISGNLQFCAGLSTELKASGGDTYAWSNGTAGAVLNVNAAGTYTVTATNAGGCTSSLSKAVVVNPNPVMSAISGNFMPFQQSSEVYSVTTNVAQYAWQINGGSIQGNANNKSVTVKWSPSADLGEVCVKGIDANGCKTDQVCEEIHLKLFVGTEEQAASTIWALSPNPVTRELHLRILDPNGVSGEGRARVYNLQGIPVLEHPVDGPDTVLDVQNLPDGLYLVELRVGHERLLKPFVKQHD